MRLSQFILSNLETIIDEWKDFAATILPEANFDQLILRDEAEHILKAIALDVETAQSATEEIEKSRGSGPRNSDDTPAEIHGQDRLRLGFNLSQMVSEFRALRASVIRLWTTSSPELNSSAVDQLVRFNEGLDQAIAESTLRFTRDLDRSRNLAAAVLAHDLRNPLNSILLAAQVLLRTKSADEDLFRGIIQSGQRMGKLVENLLDFTRIHFGQALSAKYESLDLTRPCREIIAEFVAIYPDHQIRFECAGDLHGSWDSDRIKQLLSNLISNAIKHCAPNRPVTIAANGEAQEVFISVHNEGTPIPANTISTLFDPFTRLNHQDFRETAHLGIGLYIACEIVKAHSGKISVTSTAESGTAFVVSLPRHTS